MSHDVIEGHSAKLYYGSSNDHTTATWTKIGLLTELTPPTFEVDDIETSYMESPEQWKEFIAGWKDAGEIEGTAQFQSADYSTLLSSVLGENLSFKIESKDGSTITCNGFMSTLGQEIEREGIVTVPIGIKLSGKPAFSEG